MSKEQKAVGSPFQPAETVLSGDVPTKNITEYLGWEPIGNVQRRVLSVFGLGDGPLLLRDLFVQSPCGVDKLISLLGLFSNSVKSRWYPRRVHLYQLWRSPESLYEPGSSLLAGARRGMRKASAGR